MRKRKGACYYQRLYRDVTGKTPEDGAPVDVGWLRERIRQAKKARFVTQTLVGCKSKHQLREDPSDEIAHVLHTTGYPLWITRSMVGFWAAVFYRRCHGKLYKHCPGRKVPLRFPPDGFVCDRKRVVRFSSDVVLLE
uniref:Uncharacterized protein n=1 Tax=viral metagenome TaxID=1070528 RepID=A0A6C0KE84_9ZZZZ